MRGARGFVLMVPVALAVSGCMRATSPAYTMVDPNTGQQYAVVAPPPQAGYAPPGYAQPPQGLSQGFELYGQSAQQSYAQQTPQASPQADPANEPIPNRGLFTARRSSSYVVAPQPQQQIQAQQPYVIQYGAGTYAPQPYPQQPYAQQSGTPYAAAAPYGYASASPYTPSYTLDAGDKLRITVFGQEGLTNSYTVDAGGNINVPLIGTLPVRGVTTQQLTSLITARLKQGYVREPHVSVEIEAYRPFFILGEVNNPGQYPYVANMTAEAAVAIAGGFSPRAAKGKVELTRNSPNQQIHGDVPLTYPLKPGDTIVVKERWF